jgi:hypothetical protein
MKWKKLNDKSIELLKINPIQDYNYFLIHSPGTHGFPYDIIHYIEPRDDAGESEEESKINWYSMLNDCGKIPQHVYEYTDEVLLDTYTHFIPINAPKETIKVN